MLIVSFKYNIKHPVVFIYLVQLECKNIHSAILYAASFSIRDEGKARLFDSYKSYCHIPVFKSDICISTFNNTEIYYLTPLNACIISGEM